MSDRAMEWARRALAERGRGIHSDDAEWLAAALGEYAAEKVTEKVQHFVMLTGELSDTIRADTIAEVVRVVKEGREERMDSHEELCRCSDCWDKLRRNGVVDHILNRLRDLAPSPPVPVLHLTPNEDGPAGITCIACGTADCEWSVRVRVGKSHDTGTTMWVGLHEACRYPSDRREAPPVQLEVCGECGGSGIAAEESDCPACVGSHEQAVPGVVAVEAAE